MVYEATGSIFESRADVLVNPCNTVGAMGRGLALEFTRKFPYMLKEYQKACRIGQCDIGVLHIYKAPLSKWTKYVVNFPTKKHWKNPSEMEYITEGLSALTDFVEDFGIKSIAIPAIGCGLGGLDWNKVGPMVEIAFINMTGVDAYIYPPRGFRSIR